MQFKIINILCIEHICILTELDKLHKEAVFACRKYLGNEFEKMTEDKKIISVMHYENVLVQLRKK